ncbi:hypothetical protein LPTSP3_g10500 [Leptospira kobayashii]|uniref:AB hydrolase-1 domain-containing protein n=1 Tax=Leptospira kobayashii TaxID=1917830 RepID=A0ABM7UQX5_9LEPT|nr:alpha/beta hydrolase [Leptospira kobayashii]BDA78120.1 hypothetical protein LPTSP3_g10500 [Leptospira kobayashii]
MFTNQNGIAYLTFGNPKNQSLVLVHAAGTDSSIWDYQTESLSNRFYVITYDLRGHGNSKSSTVADLNTHSEDLKNLIIGLNLNTPILCGLSLGGVIAQKYAETNPVSRLILVGSPAYSIGGKIKLIANLKKIVSVTIVRWFWPGSVRIIMDLFFRNLDFERKSYAIDLTIRNGLKTFLEEIEILFDFAGADLSNIKNITILLGEKEDRRVFEHSWFLQQKFNAKQIIIPGCYHVPNWENPAEFNRILSECL